MNKLPENFEYHKYGIDVRLATEEDSEFILSLRTNGALNVFLHETSDDLEKQRQWMREYKKREKEGLDYYFVYSVEGQPYGVNRVYNINPTNSSYTSGSWVCLPGVTAELLLKQVLSLMDITNSILFLNDNHYEVRKNNKKVIKYHRDFLKAKIEGETDLDMFFYTNAEMREKIIDRLEKYL